MKKLLWMVVLLVLAAVLWWWLRPGAPEPEVAERAEATLRATTSGDVVGYVNAAGAHVWKGIPYAAPPVGALRWRAPEPPVAWSGVREALTSGSACPQLPSSLAGETVATGRRTVGSEDCLYLNVFAPPQAHGLPVMLWIHGGGNSIGTAATYDGSELALRHQVVVVAINYRLGPLGWFAHPDLARGDALDDSGNYGTLDAVRALTWTRDNIAAFGGDAANVTVFGESAGAFDTLAMMASPLAKGLFHRAIVQSGGFSPAPMALASGYVEDGGHVNSAREVLNQLLVKDALVADRAAARTFQADMGAPRIREYLYGKSVEELFAIFDTEGSFSMLNMPSNLGDGHVLPAMTTEEIFSNSANYNAVPVILGTNRDEVALFLGMGPEFRDTFLWVLPRLKNEATYLRRVYYGSAAWKERGVDSLADYMTSSGNPNVYAYRFDWDEEGSFLGYDLSKVFGAAHGMEIAFVFGRFDNNPLFARMYAGSEGKDALSRSMMSYWTQFAVSGDPGTGRDGSERPWLAWRTDGKTSLLLDTQAGGGIRMDDAVMTRDRLKAQLAAEVGISNEERCRLFATSFGFNELDATEYAAFGPEGCAAFDPEAFRRF
ncbi:MAG: carboxylesterase family protein [Pseudomonadales bacterium]